MSRLFDNNSTPIVTKIEPSGADFIFGEGNLAQFLDCLLYTSPSPRDTR